MFGLAQSFTISHPTAVLKNKHPFTTLLLLQQTFLISIFAEGESRPNGSNLWGRCLSSKTLCVPNDWRRCLGWGFRATPHVLLSAPRRNMTCRRKLVQLGSPAKSSTWRQSQHVGCAI
ncbi:hypothetical protein CEXT_143281 [Caerostris extrusa]|uniref:Uncharacterized protein n=1 Tax=Caerostris extrusa TaxID=172846 RepID=A0AAV4QJ96_CAEEX|nr:hypothetical protein CEXT_143281 [Caerostris extrusa]